MIPANNLIRVVRSTRPSRTITTVFYTTYCDCQVSFKTLFLITCSLLAHYSTQSRIVKQKKRTGRQNPHFLQKSTLVLCTMMRSLSVSFLIIVLALLLLALANLASRYVRVFVWPVSGFCLILLPKAAFMSRPPLTYSVFTLSSILPKLSTSKTLLGKPSFRERTSLSDSPCTTRHS